MDAAERIAQAGGPDADAVALARWVSLASRVEPALLRAARVRHLSGVSAAAEADLWFGPLVRVRSPREIILYDDVAHRLRGDLSADELRAARGLVEEVHAGFPPLVLLEEALIWSLAAPEEAGGAATRELRRVISAVAGGGRPGLARWALGFLARVPAEARTPEMGLLERMAEAQIFGSWQAMLDGAGAGAALSPEERGVLARILPRVPVGIRLFAGGLEVRDEAAEGSEQVEVPATDPRVLDVEWTGTDGRVRAHRVLLPLGEAHAVPGVTRNAVLATLTGERYEIRSRAAAAGRYHKAALPFRVDVRLPASWAVALGTVVAPNTMVVPTHILDRTVAQPGVILRNRGRDLGLYDARPVLRDAHRADSLSLAFTNFDRAHEWEPAPLHEAPPRQGDRCVAWAPATSAHPEGTWVSFRVGEPLPDGDLLLAHGTALSPAALVPMNASPVLEAGSARFVGIFRTLPGEGRGPLPSLVPASRIAQALAAPAEETGGPEEVDAARFQIFVSYARADVVAARTLQRHLDAQLRSRQIPADVFLEVDQVPPGAPWEDIVVRNLESSDLFVALVSPQYADSTAQDELDWAAGRERPIVPILLRDTPQLPRALMHRQFLPREGQPLSALSDSDRAYAGVAEEVGKIVAARIQEMRPAREPAPPPEGLDDHALVIAVPSEEGLGPGGTPLQDAFAFSTWLTDPGGGAVPGDHVRHLTNPALNEVEAASDALAKSRSRNAPQPSGRRLYIFVSGVGFRAPSGDVCVLTRTPGFIWASRIADYISNGGNFREVVVLVSWMPSSSTASVELPFQGSALPKSKRSGRRLLIAGAGTPWPGEGQQPSPFTRALIDGLSGAAAERGAVTQDSLRTYIDARLRQEEGSAAGQTIVETDDSRPWLLARVDPERVRGRAAIHFRSIYEGREAIVLDHQLQQVVRATIGREVLELERPAGLYTVGVVGVGVQVPFEVLPGAEARVVVEWKPRTLRVLVAGTGRNKLPQAVQLAATALGQALAESGFKLVVGAWGGVDQLTTKAFTSRVQRVRTDIRDMLTVVRTSRLRGAGKGEVITVGSDDAWFEEVFRRAGAVILIGGAGGTLQVFRRALAAGTPVFPLLATGADAAKAHGELVERLGPGHPDLRGLDHPVRTEAEARALATGIVARLLELDAPADAGPARHPAQDEGHVA
jgi:hypothetical protein